MYLFMITCYVLMFINLVNITLVGASGMLDFSIFGANHTRFALFMILVFSFTLECVKIKNKQKKITTLIALNPIIPLVYRHGLPCLRPLFPPSYQ